MFPGKLCNPHIESRVINQHDYIGLISKHILFTLFNSPGNGSEIGDHFRESHKSQLAVMYHLIHACLTHKISAKTSELSFRLPHFYLFNKITAVQVARTLTGNEIEFHRYEDGSSLLLSKIFNVVPGGFVKPDAVKFTPIGNAGEVFFQDFPDFHN